MQRRPLTFAVAFALVAGTVIVPGVGAAGRPACLVSNERTHLGSTSLQAGIDAARAGDTLVVKGMCGGSTTLDRSLTIKGVTNQPFGEATLDGDGIARVLTIGTGLTVTITGLTITGGAGGYFAGGLLNDRSNVTLDAVTVVGNHSQYHGGGISNNGGAMTIADSVVVNNTSAVVGGGISNSGSLTLMNSSVLANTSLTGGGISSAGDAYWGNAVAYLTIKGSTISHNTARAMGGGITNGASGDSVSIMTLTDSTVSDNTAGTYGGGINNGGIGSITDSTVSHNTATTSWGGGISNHASPYPGSGALTISGSAVGSNTAGTYGGGIGNVWTPAGSGLLTITRSDVTDNIAGTGGGIYNQERLEMSNSTVTDNTATGGGGGGILNVASTLSAGALGIMNSAISSNSASYSGGGVFNAGTVSITHSTVSDNTASTGGGIYNVRSFGAQPPTLTVTHSTVSNNSVSAGSGGGIFNGASFGDASSVTLTDTTVSGNSTPYSGGGIFNRGLLAIEGSSLTLNVAKFGGGIFGDGAITFISPPSTIGGNTGTSSFGGISNSGGTVTGGCPTVLGQAVPPSTTTRGFVVYDPPNSSGWPFYMDYSGFSC